MLSLAPMLHDLVGSHDDRNLVTLRDLGAEATDRHVRIAVIVEPRPSPARRLLATALIDMLLRLDPLVGEVIVDAPGLDEQALVSELMTRVPLRVGLPDRPADYLIGVGSHGATVDLSVDAAGWLAAIGGAAHADDDDGNPVGPLAAAALAADETFKWAFAAVWPEPARRLEMMPWTGTFSFFDYDTAPVSPPIGDVRVDATLVGVGGVGAGFVRTIGALERRVSGSLVLVDDDVLTTDSLNRVSYATVAGARAGTAKVTEAQTYLASRCPDLDVVARRETFDAFKRRIPRRADRLYDVVITGLDDDHARWEVQRDLPRILIDGSTGKDMVARVERVEFGRYACLGCSRRPAPPLPGAPVACDAPPDPNAPSLSFLSAFPGVLAAGELIKEAMGSGSLRGDFVHVFRYGPNPDLVSVTPAVWADCQVGCGRSSKLAQYDEKYPRERPGG